MRLPARQQAPRRHDRHTTTVTIGGEHFRLTASQGTGGALGNVAMLGQSQRRRAPQGLRFRASSFISILSLTSYEGNAVLLTTEDDDQSVYLRIQAN